MTAYAGPYRDPTDVVGRRIGAYVIDGVIGLILMLAIGIPLFLNMFDSHDYTTNSAALEACDRINGVTTTTTPTGVSQDQPTTTEPSVPRRTDTDDRFCIPLGNTTYTAHFGSPSSACTWRSWASTSSCTP